MDLDRSILLAAGAAMLALSVVILSVGPGRGINRALAALVAARGAATLVPQVSNEPSWTWAAISVQPYFGLAVAPLAVYCAWQFTDPDGARRAKAGWWTLGAIALLDLAYLADHALVQTLAAGDATVGALRAADGISYSAFGPLWLVVGAAAPALAYLGLRLAVQYRQDPAGPLGPFRLLVSGGLVVGSLFEGTSRLAAITALLDGSGGFPWLPWGWAVIALPILALGPACLAAVVLSSGRLSAEGAQRGLERTVVLLAGFAFFSGFLRLMGPTDSDVAGSSLVLLLLGLWRLAMPAFLAYALVRYPADPQHAPARSAPLAPNAVEGRPAVR